MRYSKISNQLFSKNRHKIAFALQHGSLAIVNANDEMPRNGDQNYDYRQNSDFFYLTGIEQEKSVLILCPDHPEEDLREVLFLLKTSKELEIWEGHKLTKKEAYEISGIRNVKCLDELNQFLHGLMLTHDDVYLNLNENPRFSSDVPYRDLRFAHDLKKKYPLHRFQRLAPILSNARLRKEEEEIALIREACNITGKAFERVLKVTRPGIMEFEIEAEITHEYLVNRASGHAYHPIVASGINACSLHYNENKDKCEEGSLLLMDFGAEYANYSGDCSRTIPVNGKFSPRQRELYESTLRVFKQAREMLKPGTTINEYHKKVCQIWEEEHIKLGLYTRKDVENQDPSKPMYFKYYMHGTSHFMGLDVHDVGSKSQPLEPGMVFSCEPGIYLPEEKTGIRLENDILVTEGKPIDLMEHIPIEPDDIEKRMQQS